MPEGRFPGQDKGQRPAWMGAPGQGRGQQPLAHGARGDLEVFWSWEWLWLAVLGCCLLQWCKSCRSSPAEQHPRLPKATKARQKEGALGASSAVGLPRSGVSSAGTSSPWHSSRQQQVHLEPKAALGNDTAKLRSSSGAGEELGKLLAPTSQHLEGSLPLTFSFLLRRDDQRLEALTVLLWSICFCGISSPAGGRRHSSFSDGKGGKGSGELSSASRTTAALPAAPHPAASPLPPPPSFCSLPIPNRVPARSREAAQSPEPPSGPEPGRAGAGSRRISLPCRPGCALAGSRWQLSQVDPLPGVTHGGSAGSNKSQAPCEAIIWSFHLPGRRRRRGLCSRCAGGERAAGEAQPRASSLRLCPQQLGSTSLPAPMEFGGSGATLAAGVVPPCKLHLPGSWELLLQLPVAAPAAAPCLPGDSLEVFGW
ncbi:uncharacterized protein [Melanerpes formicivorus]|uniref:uncharacterized protein isoform X1 n=1 Tax=Melanerpes formicivorus TaxID=211600 RepID=UPI00358E8C0E